MKKLKRFCALTIAIAFLLNTIPYPAYAMKMLATESTLDNKDFGSGRDEEIIKVIERLALERDRYRLLKPSNFQPSKHFRIGDEPINPKSIPYGISARATTATAAGLTMINLRGAAFYLDKSNPQQEEQISLIKDIADSVAKRIYEQSIEASSIALSVRVSEGFGRDGVEESFKAAEVVNPGGELPRDGIMDVIEGTNSFVTNVDGKSLMELKDSESGATSIMITGEGVESLGNCPDYYVDGIFTTVPKKKRQGFLSSPLDPEIIAENPAIIENYLFRIAKANNINIGDLEVIVMKRPREKKRLEVLERLQKKYPGLEIITIKDGTVAHSLLATFDRKEGKHKVVMTVGGAPEGFFNLATASTFAEEGALASIRIYSKNVNKTADGEKAEDLKERYNFDVDEEKKIEELRPQDYEEIISGNKLFTQQDVRGDVKGSMAFITHNGVFRKPGVEKLADGSYKVQILRFGKVTEGKPCVWFDEQVFTPEELSFAENILTDHEIKDLLAINKYSEQLWFANLQRSEEMSNIFSEEHLTYLAERLSWTKIVPDNAKSIYRVLRDATLFVPIITYLQSNDPEYDPVVKAEELAWQIHSMQGFVPLAENAPEYLISHYQSFIVASTTQIKEMIAAKEAKEDNIKSEVYVDFFAFFESTGDKKVELALGLPLMLRNLGTALSKNQQLIVVVPEAKRTEEMQKKFFGKENLSENILFLNPTEAAERIGNNNDKVRRSSIVFAAEIGTEKIVEYLLSLSEITNKLPQEEIKALAATLAPVLNDYNRSAGRYNYGHFDYESNVRKILQKFGYRASLEYLHSDADKLAFKIVRFIDARTWYDAIKVEYTTKVNAPNENEMNIVAQILVPIHFFHLIWGNYTKIPSALKELILDTSVNNSSADAQRGKAIIEEIENIGVVNLPGSLPVDQQAKQDREKIRKLLERYN